MVKKIYSLKNKFSFVDKNFAHTILSKEFPEAYKHLIPTLTYLYASIQ